ncbi:MAG: hypothetical protein HY937_08910 [Nitrosomonadales bacterium]|nr:hypothetical protein [Nitrosomonadales bacterium]
MLKSIVKALGLIAGLALSGVACAMGMGGINVTTALGEPLRAEIELVAVGKAEKNSLSAHLASPAIFKGAGMDYPSGLPKLKFQIETRANGESYLKVTSVQPVNEPFVSLLVELSWSSGRLLREYTFLLDPPGYKAEQPKAAEVEPVAPSVEAAPSIVTAPIRATAPMEEKVLAEAATPAPAGKPPASSNVASGVIKVKRGDTLSAIARQAKPSDVSLERMLVALYRANAGAFAGKNMNRLKTGKILHMPANQDLDKLAQAEAVKEIRVQVADWHAYRQKLAAASGSVAEHAPQQEATGKISTTVADKAPAAKESAKEVVRLSKGEAPGDKAVTAGDAKALQDKVHALEEDAIAKGKALKESNERVAMLEKNIKEMQHLIELKGQLATPVKPVLSKVEGPVPGKAEGPAEIKPLPKPEPAKVEVKQPTPAPAAAPVAASQPPAAPAAAAASAVAPASAVKPAKPAAKPVAMPQVEPPPTSSMMDELAGGAAVLLALGGLGFMLARRVKGGKAEKKISGSSEAETKDIGVTSGRFSAPVAPSPETGDFTQAATATPTSPVQPEDIDPINEADLFLSFGRDAQAEEILKDALEKNPANNQIRLKLLSIYANRKDTKSFSVIARQVQDSGDAAAWAQAAETGRNLEPGNPMYGGKGGEPVIAAPVDQGKSEPQHAAGLDFDLGSGAPAAAAATESESTMVPPGEKTMAMPLQGLRAAEAPMDFDITSTHPSLAAITEEKPAADISASTDDALAFTLDFPTSDKPAAAQAAAKEVVDFDLSGISLDLGEPTAPASAPAAEVKDAHWHDVATKLDLAKAYQEMGDNAGAREILEEVLAEGDEPQRAAAEDILQHLLA